MNRSSLGAEGKWNVLGKANNMLKIGSKKESGLFGDNWSTEHLW